MEDLEKILEENQPLILFDGVCNFCNGFTRFIIEHDPEKKFCFAPLQSDIGEAVREKYGVEVDRLESVILIDDSEVFLRTEAVARILENMDGYWSSIGYFLSIIPKPLADINYKIFSSLRYRVFGKKDQCIVPEDDIRERFIDY